MMEEQKTDLKESEPDRIGNFLAEDVCAFANVEWRESTHLQDKSLGIVSDLVTYYGGYYTWNLFGGLFSSDWLVYRGMIPQGIVTCILSWIYLIIVMMISFKVMDEEGTAVLVGFVVFVISRAILMGMMSTGLYDSYMSKRLTARGLDNSRYRGTIHCEELKESLAKEGKPSIKRVLFFRVLRMLVFFVVCSILIASIRNIGA